MARLVGYMANRADRLAAALYQERAVVAPPPATGPTGWGLGFYQGGEVLHKKRPQFDPHGFDWGKVAKDVHSDCALLHLRQPTVGDFRTQNTHPFRMRSWLFAHTGTIERFDAIRESLIAALPDFVARNIRGKTDSEHLFHVILSFIHDAGQLDAPDVDAAKLVSAVRSGTALVDRLTAEVGAPPACLNMVLTNGRTMLGLRRGAPMAWVQRRGLHDPPPDVTPSKGGTPSVLRYIMVVSDATAATTEYQELPESSLVVINRKLELESHTL